MEKEDQSPTSPPSSAVEATMNAATPTQPTSGRRKQSKPQKNKTSGELTISNKCNRVRSNAVNSWFMPYTVLHRAKKNQAIFKKAHAKQELYGTKISGILGAGLET